MKRFDDFTRQFPVSKTLRFELIPQGETLENIKRSGILDRDLQRAESYKKMKKTIDQFHKDFIDRSLESVMLDHLEEYYETTTAPDANREKQEQLRQALRKEIVHYFKINEDFSILDKKELIQKRLEGWIEHNDPSLFYDADFKNFTTYFTGYNQNRMNMYTDEPKASAVAYRLIDENLPKHLNNISVFQKIMGSGLREEMEKVYEEMEPWIHVSSLEEVFSLQNYNNLLTQDQIDAYNTIIGGFSEGNTKHKGINEHINLYNQQNKTARLPKMEMLFKQILSDRESSSWLPESFESAEELLEALGEMAHEYLEPDENGDVYFDSLRNIIKDLPDRETEQIYLRNDNSINKISKELFNDPLFIKSALGHYYEVVIDPQFPSKYEKAKTEAALEKLEKQKHGFVSGSDYLSVAVIHEAIAMYWNTVDRSAFDSDIDHAVENVLGMYYSQDRLDGYIADIAQAHEAAEALLKVNHSEDYRLTSDDKELLKGLLDSMVALLHYIKPLYVRPDASVMKDTIFYGTFSPLFEQYQNVSKMYDKVRNFVTKKPYSTEKVKLNFDCSTLLNGWDVNKERDNLGVILRKDGKYYLGIMLKSDNKVFEELEECHESDCFEKMQYKLLPGPNKMLPKVFFSKSRIEEFAPSDDILSIRERETFKKGPQFDLDDCHKFIDFFKQSIGKHPDWKQFDFQFSDTETYQDISEFYREVSDQGYKLSFRSIAKDRIDQLVKEGRLYLFQIYNKDFSEFSKGKPNLHTMYWKALFDEENLADVVYKLNGEAEVFYRKRSIDDKDKVVHPANVPITSKNPLRGGDSSTFPYAIEKDRRYTVDKFQFHVPITMNFKSAGATRINEKVCEYIKNNPDLKIIGIDRGERHLLYISMIDRNGDVVRDKSGELIQYSLNTITGEYTDAQNHRIQFQTPYRELLDAKEKQRENARENWGTIENIKELKSGYLSQVVHHIAKLVVEYGAIVVMEDLNSGFKRSRVKVEKQVYQNFEKQLIQKLNYLVFKDFPEDKPGGLYHALQLTEEFRSFRELRKQSGVIFYVPAWNTSKIDPVTGFVDLLKPKYKNITEAHSFFEKFDRISYNKEHNRFEFEFDYDNFTQKADGTKTKWTVCTEGDLRYSYNPRLNNNRGGYEKWNVTESLKKLFTTYDIVWESEENLVPGIVSKDTAAFYTSLIKNLRITLAMRYSCPEDGKDFILSPVADDTGVFFNSEDVALHHKALPQDADANGAYNIARKGLMVAKQIDDAETMKDWTTAISNREWLSFVQN